MVTIEHPLGGDFDVEDTRSFSSITAPFMLAEKARIRYLELVSAVNVLVSKVEGKAGENFKKIFNETFKAEGLLSQISDSHTLSTNIHKVLDATKSLSKDDFCRLASNLVSLLDQNAELLCNIISGSDQDIKTSVFQQVVKIKESAKAIKSISGKLEPVTEDMNFLIQGLDSILRVAGRSIIPSIGEKKGFEDYAKIASVMDFYDAYHKQLAKDKQGIRGFVGRLFTERAVISGVQEGWNLEQIIDHAFSQGGRTLAVLENLKWIEKIEDHVHGDRTSFVYNFTKSAPDAFKKAFIAYFEGPDFTPDSTPRISHSSHTSHTPSSPRYPR